MLIHGLLWPLASLAGEGERRARECSGQSVVAEARAKGLLLRVLAPKQREEFARSGYFAVEVAGRGTFVILPVSMFNVLEIATGDCYCAGPGDGIQVADLMLAQKFLLENDPDQFSRVANCRHEVVVGLVDEQTLPEQVLRARKASHDARVRCWEVPCCLP